MTHPTTRKHKKSCKLVSGKMEGPFDYQLFWKCDCTTSEEKVIPEEWEERQTIKEILESKGVYTESLEILLLRNLEYRLRKATLEIIKKLKN